MHIQTVNNSQELSRFLSEIEDETRIAADLEFDKNLHRYGFNLCLVQIYACDTCYLIDPLSKDLDIGEIFPLFENPVLEKVVFAFGEDLRLLHSLGCHPENLYDLGVAVSLLDYEPASLTNHLINILGIETESGSQQSNWYQRPLSEKQKIYASEDVFYLIPLKDVLAEQARQKGILQWIEQENRRAEERDYSDINGNDIIKEKEMKEFNEVEWHLYKELLHAREEIAEEVNKPAYQVFSKEIIKKMIRDEQMLDNWQNIRGIYRAVKTNRVQQRLKDILLTGRQSAKELDLSPDMDAEKKLTKEESDEIRRQQREIQQAKRELFDPVKREIENDYGKNAASFMLSNRIVAEIVSGRRDNIPEYKIELIHKYSAKIGADPSGYFSGVERESGD